MSDLRSTRLRGLLLGVLPLALSCNGPEVQLVEQESPPTVAIFEPADASSALQGTPVTFVGEVQDEQDDPDLLQLSWSSDRDGLLDEAPSDGTGRAVFTTSNLSVGGHAITLRALDSDNLSAEDYILIRIEEVPDAPTITVRSPAGREEGVEGVPFTFEAIVADGSDIPRDLTVAFESDLDGTFCEPQPDALGLAVCEEVLSVGEHLLTFTVFDTDGYNTSATAYFDVVSLLDIDDDGDGYTENEGDCDDSEPTRNPGETETYDEVDEDCDSVVDDGTIGHDDDGDGESEVDGDCDDEEDDIFSGAQEVCDALDNDCDNQVDEDTPCADDDGDGLNEVSGDCDDGSAITYPGAPEVPDGQDNDCDGIRDEGTQRYDADGDCYCVAGSCSGSTNFLCTVIEPGDCDDRNAAFSPAATEVPADGVDQDCDGDELCFADVDGDAYGIQATVASTDLDCTGTGEAEEPGDCDDADASTHPGVPEIPADGFDSDCDGAEVCYRDGDGDGFGSGALSESSDLDCDDANEALDALDCDDANSTVRPGALELAGDEVDQDCDGAELCFADRDRDVFRDVSTVVSADLQCRTVDGEAIGAALVDCDDANPGINPATAEQVGDGVDGNCDGRETCFQDVDRDGFRAAGTVSSPDASCDTSAGEATSSAVLDCDDARAVVNPAATELAGDELDQDCDGTELCFVDNDRDGARQAATRASGDRFCTAASGEAVASAALDCNDADPAVRPGATETAGDGVDLDCDGRETCFADVDRDGFRGPGTVASPDLSCAEPGEASAATAADCDDLEAEVYPGATEVVGDEVDSDCNLQELCYADADRDQYRSDLTVVSNDATCSTVLGEARAAALSDCDDTDRDINPGAAEVVGDEVDQDCDGAESCYVDSDLDGFRGPGSVVSADVACDAAGEAPDTSGQDCNDANPAIRPGATEIPGDEVDQDCDRAELCYVDLDRDQFRSEATTSSIDVACTTTLGEARATALPDCDDDDRNVNPSAAELAGDGVDQDCDGAELCFADVDVDGFRGTANVLSPDVACDGAGEASSGAAVDCNDGNAAVFPGATELAGDEVDSDCNGSEVCFLDFDRDQFRSSDTVISADSSCTTTFGEARATAELDCSDGSAAVNPDAAEIVGDGVDQDCDGAELCFVDADRDGFRTAATVASPDLLCSTADGEAPSSAGLDCDDGNSAVRPTAVEQPGDEVDQDCDTRELCFVDADRDGFRTNVTVLSPDTLCSTGSGEAPGSAGFDCYDSNANAFPGQTSFFGTNRGDGSFDYDCDGGEARFDTSTVLFACQSQGGNCTFTDGWVGSAPACGTVGTFGTGCTFRNPDPCTPASESQTIQSCR